MSSRRRPNNSPQSKERTRPSWQAQFAFYLSIATALFSGFQFFHNVREAKTSATIDIARKYLSDQDVAAGRQIAMASILGEIPDLTRVPVDRAEKVNAFVINTSYLADLLQKDRIDEDYLTDVVVCDIWIANEFTSKRLPKGTDVASIERDAKSSLRKLGSKLNERCSRTIVKHP